MTNSTLTTSAASSSAMPPSTAMRGQTNSAETPRTELSDTPRTETSTVPRAGMGVEFDDGEALTATLRITL